LHDFKAIQEAVINGDEKRLVDLVSETLSQDVKPADIISLGLQPGMIAVGEKFSSGEFFIPDMLYAARAMNRAMEVLRPRLAGAEALTIGKILIGTVAGDIHDIGKNLVIMFLRGAGFEVLDLGINVPAASFVSAVKEHHPDILGLSALLTTTMPAMKATVQALDAEGCATRLRWWLAAPR